MGNKFFTVVALISILVLASCDNKNIFGKFTRSGSSANIEVLLSDANAALVNNNPSKAKAIADKILVKDPNNSEALYISAAAGLKESGLDLASILTNVMASTSTVSGDNLLPENINLANLASATANAVTQLKKIADGQADGTIPPNDVDVNLNLGIVQVLNAATRLFDLTGTGDFGGDDEPITLTSDFEVKINTTALSNLKGNTTAQSQVKEVMILLVGGNNANTLLGGTTSAPLIDANRLDDRGCVEYLTAASDAINLGQNNTTLADLQDNVDDLTGDNTSTDTNTVWDIWSLLQTP